MLRGRGRGYWANGISKKHLKLEEGKRFCATEYCYQAIWSWNKHCESCQLNRYPEIYTERCRSCWRKALKTSGYCSNHDKKCLSCDSREVVTDPYGQSYCTQHARSCITCSVRTPTGQLYCSVHQKQEDLKNFVKQKASLFNPQQITRFETWWNKNLATVINQNNGYWVFLVVYEPAHRNISENLVVFPPNSNQYSSKWGQSNRQQHNDLSNAQNEASWLRGMLDSDNPILYVHPSANSYVNFGNIVREPYVIKNDLPYTYRTNTRWSFDGYVGEYVTDTIGISYPDNPDEYLKPLDIVKVNFQEPFLTFYHFGIYLGNNEVCNYSKEKNGTDIVSWSEFLKGGENWFEDEHYGMIKINPVGLTRYHPMIPFKNTQRIAEQIAWVKDVNYQHGNYNLVDRNCEHFTNMIVYGINYSEQVENSSLIGLGYSNKNNGKGSTIKLTNEVSESNSKLGERDNQRAKHIKDQYKAQVEISARNNCQIM